MRVLRTVVSVPSQSFDDLRKSYFEEFEKLKPKPSLESKRYELGRHVSEDYKIQYSKEVELRANEKLASLSNDKNTVVYNHEELGVDESVKQVFAYEHSITDSLRQSIMEQFDCLTGEEFELDTEEVESVQNTAHEDMSLRYSDEEVEEMDAQQEQSFEEYEEDEGVSYEEDSEEESDEDEYDSYDDYDTEESDEDVAEESTDEYNDSEEEESDEDDYGDYDSDDSDEDNYDSYSEEDTSEEDEEESDEDNYDSYDEDEESDDYDSYGEEDEEEEGSTESEDYTEDESDEDESEEDDDYGSYDEDTEEDDDYDSYDEDNQEEDDYSVEDNSEEDSDDEYDYNNEEEEVSYVKRQVTNYSDRDANTVSDIGNSVNNSTATDISPTYSLLDTDIDEEDLGFVEKTEQPKQVVVEKPKGVEQGYVLKPDAHKEMEKPVEPEPTDLRQFIRKHPRCEYNFALQYFTKKQINDAIKVGKVIKRGNILKV